MQAGLLYIVQMSDPRVQNFNNEPYDEGIQVNSSSQISSNQSQNQQNQEDPHIPAGIERPLPIQGGYNPAEYASLPVDNQVKQLFKHIGRYKPQSVQIQAKLRAFIPDYIPAVGEVDAFLKMPRPDSQVEILGLNILDEPALNQSDKAKIDLIMANTAKQRRDNKLSKVHSIEDASKNHKQIQQWIESVADIHKIKQPPSVSYSKGMPDIDSLMQQWPAQVQQILNSIRLPEESLDVSLEEYCKIALAILDIPVHSANSERNVIESMHVMFSLFSAFKENVAFKQFGQ